MRRHSDAFVGVHSAGLIYVIFREHDAFDAIPLPATTHENGCISKVLESGNLQTIFQYWTKNKEGNE